ncbi:MAG TPA: hypothetical protein VGP93_10635, partial [Polyangiaceae bacterium]|nr:hypothetical protein [Polyangiaceae bacterium]
MIVSLGQRRVLIRAGSGVFASALAIFSCSASDGSQVRAGPMGGQSGMGGGLGFGDAGADAGILIGVGTSSCNLLEAGPPIFADSVIGLDAPPVELYSWTTPEQIAEIRTGQVLLTRTEREGLGRGYAFDLLDAIAARSTDPSAALASYLAGEAFAKARYTWPHPWATRMGWPGESYGNELIRIKLKPDSWVVRILGESLNVIDLDNNPITLEQALATPERIAAIYFIKLGGESGPICGSFQGGGNGYREVIVGNEAMIEEWSLATADIRARLESDIAQLSQFLERIRVCPEGRDPRSWNLSVSCNWDFGTSATEFGAYEAALAMPSPLYLPA